MVLRLVLPRSETNSQSPICRLAGGKAAVAASDLEASQGAKFNSLERFRALGVPELARIKINSTG